MQAELLILVDNSARDTQLKTEHGLSILVSYQGRRLLLDAAHTPEALLHNARQLGEDLSNLDGVILSHGHYDHAGGLSGVFRDGVARDLYAHPRAFAKRWSQKPGKPLKDVSCPHRPEVLQAAGAVIKPVTAPHPLGEGMVISGPIGGVQASSESFVIRKGDDIVEDRFEDELCLLVRGRMGWAVVTGCCHRGLRNTLRTAKFLARNEPITAVVGGLHLRSASEDELDRVIAVLDEFDTPTLYPCHCTGDASIAYLEKQLGVGVRAVSAGSRITV